MCAAWYFSQSPKSWKETMILSHDGHGNRALASRISDVNIRHSIYYQGVNGFGVG
jgi:hypothetical protein